MILVPVVGDFGAINNYRTYDDFPVMNDFSAIIDTSHPIGFATNRL